MADKKKKSPAKALLNSSRKKLIIESVNNASSDEAESVITTQQSVLKGKPTKAVKQSITDSFKQAKQKAIEQMGEDGYKQAVKSGEIKKIQSRKSLTQAVLTGSANKAVKALIQEPFRIAQEKQKALNKEYRTERNKLIRRINYFEKKGFEFDKSAIAPKLDGNATQEDIQRLREIYGKNLRNLSTGFTPPVVETEPVTPEEIELPLIPDDYQGIEYTDDMFDSDYENFIEEDDFRPTFEDLVYEDKDEFFTNAEKLETPQERYYRENSDRQYDETEVNAGEAVLANAWGMIRDNDSYLSIMPMKRENKEIKEEATYALAEMLSKAEDTIDSQALSIILQKHASEFNSSVERALRWRDSNDVDRTRSETSYALTKLNNILFSSDPALLAEYSTGNPADL